MKYTLITLIFCAITAISIEKRPDPKFLDIQEPGQKLIPESGGQLIINELLFNPKKDGVDFVELFNPSGQSINLQEVWIANINNAGNIANMQRISEAVHHMMPGTYRVLTIDPLLVANHYPKARLQNFIKMNRLPAFNNDQGRVLLIHQPGINIGSQERYLLDSLSYSEDMHSPFIKDPKGISLERVDLHQETNEPGNFRSAAVAAGGATPGYQNSTIYDSQTQLHLKSRIISPDKDGIDDELVIEYNIAHLGLMANIHLYNSKGRLIKNVLRNSSIPSQGFWTWEGQNEAGLTVAPGIYTIVIELYNDQGYRQVFRKSFVVALRN